MDDEIWKVFTSETLEITDALEESILSYEKTTDKSVLQQAYHQVHSIKGSLGIIEFNKLEALVHKLEDLFHLCLETPFLQISNFVRTVLRTVDLVRKVINMENENAVDPDVQARFLDLFSMDYYSASSSQDKKNITEKKSADKMNLLRIDSSRLDELLDLTGELLTVGDSFRQLMDEIPDSRLRNRTSMLLGLIDQLSEKTLEMRMIPLSSLMNRFKRTVHDLAEETGKKVQLEISGEQTEVDKTIADKLIDPLTHLIRNSIDHGIDDPEQRRKLAKPETGIIHMSARHDHDSILISLEDDGAGLDYKKILEKARNYAEWNGSEAEEDLANLIFEPGFSTARTVSNLSGRGMGMSAVKDSIQQLRGSLSIRSTTGKGTRFEMKLPLSLALVEGLLIRMDQNFYIIPSEDVIECMAVDAQEIDQSLDLTTTAWKGSLLPIVNLKRIMNMSGYSENVVIVKNQNTMSGVLCDEIVDTIQTVVKPLHPLLKSEPWLQGSSVLGSGEPVLIMNMPGLFDQFRI